MTRFVCKGAALAAALLIAALSLPATAEAGSRHHHHGGAAVAAGLMGLAVGAMIGGAIARDRPAYGYYDDYAPPPDVVYVERRVYRAPPPYAPPPAAHAPAPWTPDWYAYCHSKYRSFDRRSGTYQPYHGPRRFCR